MSQQVSTLERKCGAGSNSKLKTSASPFFGFDDGAGVMCDQSAQHGIGVLGVAQVMGAVECVQARRGQVGRVADVMQPCGGFQEFGVSAQNRCQAACPGGDALDMRPAVAHFSQGQPAPGTRPGLQANSAPIGVSARSSRNSRGRRGWRQPASRDTLLMWSSCATAGASHLNGVGDEGRVSVSAEVSALVGVVLGAVLSFVATYTAERASWLRNQAVRWDERRLSAYADYGHAVKEQVALASRIAAARGLDSRTEPLEPSQESLAQLAEAEARRTLMSETLRLLADAETMVAANEVRRCAWVLVQFARGITDGDSTDWDRAFLKYEKARDHYMTCARKNLQVDGSPIYVGLRLRRVPGQIR
jgi:hypothetical protein